MTPRGPGIRRPSIAGDRWSCASSSAAAATAPCIARGIPQLTRDVALKLLNVEHADAQAFERSVITEGRLLARVRHPNVIAVYGADSHDGRVGFWMEFLEGQTLKQWVDAHGRMSSREAAIVGIDICRALAAVHGAGLVHRDVKAQNVMREAGGRTVLMDFGTGAESGRAARLAGTPLYIAPELFADAPATPRTDIYSVGVLLFYLVSGSFPVSGVTLSDIRQAHASGRRQTLRDVRPDLPAAFVRVVDRALSPDPAGRPATAGALEADLTTSLELLSATPAPVAGAAAPPRRQICPDGIDRARRSADRRLGLGPVDHRDAPRQPRRECGALPCCRCAT